MPAAIGANQVQRELPRDARSTSVLLVVSVQDMGRFIARFSETSGSIGTSGESRTSCAEKFARVAGIAFRSGIARSEGLAEWALYA
jgi:hypothetical protein